MERNPYRKIKKDQWKKENWDRVRFHWRQYRKRRLENLGVDEYLRKEAERMSEYRRKHPEIIHYLRFKNRVNVDERLKTYKWASERDGKK